MKASDKKGRQSVEIVDKLVMVSTYLMKVGNRQIARFGVTQSQFAVLGEIIRNEGISQKEIVGELLLEKSNLSKIIRKLEEMGLIVVKSGKEDRRQSILRSTAKGRRLRKDCMDSLDRLKSRFTEPLSDDEMAVLAPAVDELKALVLRHIQIEKQGEE